MAKLAGSIAHIEGWFIATDGTEIGPIEPTYNSKMGKSGDSANIVLGPLVAGDPFIMLDAVFEKRVERTAYVDHIRVSINGMSFEQRITPPAPLFSGDNFAVTVTIAIPL